MMTGLEQELVAVAGISRAHVDAADEDGVTLHVELDDDADRDSVTKAVDVVLRRHGLRSRARPPIADLEESVPDHALPAAEGESVETLEIREEYPEPATTVDDRPTRDRIAEVTLGYTDGRVTVTVRSVEGREVRVETIDREASLDRAIAGAVGELLGHRVPPEVTEVTRRDVGSRRAVTVVLDLGDDLMIGTSFERGSGPLGIARAVWNALSGD